MTDGNGSTSCWLDITRYLAEVNNDTEIGDMAQIPAPEMGTGLSMYGVIWQHPLWAITSQDAYSSKHKSSTGVTRKISQDTMCSVQNSKSNVHLPPHRAASRNAVVGRPCKSHLALARDWRFQTEIHVKQLNRGGIEHGKLRMAMPAVHWSWPPRFKER